MSVTSLAQFKAGFILDYADYEIIKRGKSYFDSWNRCRLQSLNAERASYIVRGTHDYDVGIFVEFGEFRADCDCPYANESAEIICKHKVAAALHLEKHLRYQPIPDWRHKLESFFNSQGKKSGENKFLIFSLQAENSRWQVVPYSFPSRYFPPEIWHDPGAIQETLLNENLIQSAKKMKPDDYRNEREFVNLELKQRPVLKLFSGSYGFGGYGFSFETFAALIDNLPFFRGSHVNPFKIPLHIYSGAANLEFDLQRAENGLNLQPQIVLSELNERVRLKTAEILNNHPLWLLAGQKIFHLPETSYLFEQLKANAALKIPLAEESFFWEKFLPRLAENYPVTGEAVNFRELADEGVAPRLYLREKDELLQIELRFGYGAIELSAEKNPSAQAIRRDAQSGVLYRFRRDLNAEHYFRELLSEARFGTKKTAEADVFLLRAKIHPFDFLTKYIPLLTVEGFEVFGEESLKKRAH